jgi:adenylate kinase
MKDIILIGRQGSGKGTQGKILAEKFGYQIFETGGALRQMAQQDSDLGRQVKEITGRGDLVSNEIVMAIVRDFLAQLPATTPVIFDGIPRSEVQRESLEAELKEAGRDWTALEIRISNEEAVHRLLKRAEIEGRADDNITAIQKRLENFEMHTQPILDIWAERDLLLAINGKAEIDSVHGAVVEALNLK